MFKLITYILVILSFNSFSQTSSVINKDCEILLTKVLNKNNELYSKKTFSYKSKNYSIDDGKKTEKIEVSVVRNNDNYIAESKYFIFMQDTSVLASVIHDSKVVVLKNISIDKRNINEKFFTGSLYVDSLKLYSTKIECFNEKIVIEFNNKIKNVEEMVIYFDKNFVINKTETTVFENNKKIIKINQIFDYSNNVKDIFNNVLLELLIKNNKSGKYPDYKLVDLRTKR